MKLQLGHGTQRTAERILCTWRTIRIGFLHDGPHGNMHFVTRTVVTVGANARALMYMATHVVVEKFFDIKVGSYGYQPGYRAATG